MAEKTGQVLQIRTNEELVAKFKQISEELEVPYGSALELLLQSYDIGQLKAVVPDRAKEIEEVEIITRRFLEIYQNIFLTLLLFYFYLHYLYSYLLLKLLQMHT